MNTLNLNLLGKFQTTCGLQPLPPFRTSKVQALLIYLVVEALQPDITAVTGSGQYDYQQSSSVQAPLRQAQGTAVSHRREALMELLWPNMPLKSSQDNLRQTLYQLRKTIPDQQLADGTSIPFLESSRVSVNLHPAYVVNLDSVEFSRQLQDGRLEAAVSLYHGDFLEDFYLPESSQFEEWAQVHRQNYRESALDAFDELTGRYMGLGQYEKALDFARRQLAIDNLCERAYRRQMAALARLGRREAALDQYELCRQQLAQELGIDPSAETEELFKQILRDEIRAVESDDLEVTVLSPSGTPAREIEEQQQFFVGREKALQQLSSTLTGVTNGAGSMQFIVGGAGRGKTALVTAFAQRALAENPYLLVLSGHCRGPGMAGEPYLPWRQILAQLSGYTRGPALLSREQARRLRQAMPQTLPLLCEQGPDLIDTLIPGADLRHRAATVGSPQVDWFRLLCRRLDEPERYSPQKDHLFSQVSAVLKELSKIRPLLIIIDDLHWTDAATVGLLHHLSFDLAQSRLLLLGTYRPEEVITQEGHPLNPIRGELKRRFGAIWLDLSAIDAQEGLDFITSYLDSEANELNQEFRQKLFTHTGGHALFTIELLRAMQERGELYQDNCGIWQQQKDVNWKILPARVEGVIEQRFERLDDDLQTALAIAAVQGESFTAEIIAAIQEIDPRQLIRRLSREVEGRHRLILAGEIDWHDGRRLAQYRFRHQLFQQFLYQQLDEGERAYLHEAVGLALEDQYGPDAAEAAMLAWHFDQAGNEQKALPYLLQAGDAARLLYATEEATRHYERALAILRGHGDYEQAAKVLMKLGLTHANAYDFEAARMAYDESFSISRHASAAFRYTTPSQAPHALRLLFPDPVPTLDMINIGVEDWGLFPGLVQLTAELDVVPDVAHSWDILDGGCTYIFHLRNDVYWSDGAPVTAQDFAFAWRRVLHTISGSPYASMLYDIRNTANYHRGSITDSGDLGFQALDDHTLQVKVLRPTAYFLQVLTHRVATAVPRHVIDAHGDLWSEPENIVTSGPFYVQSRDEHLIILHRNPAYHHPPIGNVEVVEIRFCDPGVDELSPYEENELDVTSINSLPLSKFKEVVIQYADQYRIVQLLQTGYLIFDVNQPPFDNPLVRKACVLAADRRHLAEFHEGGRHFPATGGFVPPGMPGHVASIGLPYDPQEGRNLLAAAGYPSGKNLPEIRSLLTPWGVPRVSEHIFQPWQEQLGIEIDWQKIPWGNFFELLKKEEIHIIYVAWPAYYPDPDSFLRVALSKLTNWNYEPYEKLINQARHSLDNRHRLKLFRKAEEILVDQAPILPLLYLNDHILIKPWIKNFQPQTISRPFWHHVIIEPH